MKSSNSSTRNKSPKGFKKGSQVQIEPPSVNWLEENVNAILKGALFVAVRPLRNFGPDARGQTDTILLEMPTLQEEAGITGKIPTEIKRLKNNFSQPYAKILQEEGSRGICYAQDIEIINKTTEILEIPPPKMENPTTIGEDINFFKDGSHYKFYSQQEIYEASLHSNIYFSSPQIFEVLVILLEAYNPQEEVILYWSKLAMIEGCEIVKAHIAIIKIEALVKDPPIQINEPALAKEAYFLRHQKYEFTIWLQQFIQDGYKENKAPLQSFEHYVRHAQKVQVYRGMKLIRGKYEAILETAYNPDHAKMLHSGKAMCYEIGIEKSNSNGQARVWLIVGTFSPMGETDILEPHSFWMIDEYIPGEYGSQEWVEALKQQTSLELRIRTAGKDYYPIAILKGKAFHQYLEALEWQANCKIVPYIESKATTDTDLAKRIISALRNVQYSFLSHHTQEAAGIGDLLEATATFIKNEFPGDHELYRQVTQTEQTWEEEILFLGRYFVNHHRKVYEQTYCRDPKTGSRKLFQYLSTQGEDIAEDLVKDFLFTFSTLAINQSSSRFEIPTGLNSVLKAWNIRFYKESKLNTAIALKLAGTYRYLLGRCWEPILDPQDVIKGNDENTILFTRGLSNVPPKPQFQEIKKILQAAQAKQHFVVDQRTTVVIETDGCHQITFTPDEQKPGEFLFKVVIHQERVNNNLINSCLVGYLDPNNAQIKWATPVPSEHIEKELDLLLFLVAISYRDLVVARERYTTRSNQKTKGPTTYHKQSKKTEIQLIPRFKSTLHGRFGDPELFLSAIRRHFSFRSAHIRRLPEGYSPSDTQIELAEQFGFFLPPGYTFVRSAFGEDSLEQEKIFRSISLMELLCEDDQSS